MTRLVIILLFICCLLYSSWTIYRTLTINQDVVDYSEVREEIDYPLYFNFYRSEKILTFDDSGVMYVDFDKKNNLTSVNGRRFSPIATGLFLLNYIQKCFKDEACKEADLETIRVNADFVLQAQDKDGLWRIPFSRTYNGKFQAENWPSGLAQAFIGSALLRLGYHFDDELYTKAAIRGFLPFATDVESGGLLYKGEDFLFIEEYPYKIKSDNYHVVNGYFYAIIALADACNLAKKMCNEYGVDEMLSLHKSNVEDLLYHIYLPGGWSKYALDVPNLRNHWNYANPFYHDIHIAQLAYFCKDLDVEKACKVSSDFEAYAKDPSVASVLVRLAYVVFQDLVMVKNLFDNVFARS